jgi:carbamoyltransferase
MITPTAADGQVRDVLGFLGHLKPRVTGGQSIFADWDSGWYHNSAAALVSAADGVVAAVEEERLSRHKHTGVFPTAALRHCLHRSPAKPALVAFGELGGYGELRDPAISAGAVCRLLESEIGLDVPETAVTLVDHHTSHAYSAAYASGFEDALVVTFDGFGDGISGSFRMMTAGHLEPVYRTIPFAASLGRLYSSVLSYLGYDDGDEYKVMGLAPRGDASRLHGLISDLYALGDEGDFVVHDHDRSAVHQRLLALGPARPPGGEFAAHHADVAAAIQDALEQIALHAVRHETAMTGARFACLAGGVAHNSVMIGRLQRELKLENLFVQPAADDSGIAIGAAYAGLDAAGVRARRGLPHVFLGPDIGDPAAAIDEWAGWITAEKRADPAGTVAALLVAGAVVGVARGPMEFGPRALGNRSILADPRRADAKDRVNRLVKSRESFRPFAPAVIEEDAARFFELDLPAPAYRFMTSVTRVRPEWQARLPAVTHVDGSARLQTVAADASPFLHAVLRRFGDLTCVPVLLNTSLNNNREPVVASASDAIVFLLTSGVDCLLLGDFIVRRSPTEARRKLLHAATFTLRPGCFAAANGATYVVTGPSGRPTPIGRAAFDTITRDAGAAAPADALDDLQLLWAERLITVTPTTQRTEEP